MAKVMCCKDMGVDCDFVARGETVDDLLRVCAEHGREAHGIDQLPPELVEKAKAGALLFIRDE